MKHTVLIVDDETIFADSLAERLELRGFNPMIAYNGMTAMDIFLQNKPPLVILDLRLPDVDGSEVLLHIMRQEPDTRVVIITGHGSEEDKQICLKRGAAAFLNKPIHLHELVSVLLDGEEK